MLNLETGFKNIKQSDEEKNYMERYMANTKGNF
jgi:hypothetical protein